MGAAPAGKRGKLDFTFSLWTVLPDFKHCPGFLNRAIREIRAKFFFAFLAVK